jgi:hypothetical protein
MTPTIKRRDMGIAGAIIVLSQAVTSLQSSHSISGQVEELKTQLETSKIEREQYFVRKTELVTVVAKIDKLSDQVSDLKNNFSRFQIEMQDKYSLQECDPLIPTLQCDEVASRD